MYLKNALDTPLISVIVPVYNAAPYLIKCVKSILNQTYRNLEIILVDDGATDGSEKICDMLEKHDSRIKVVHKENGGAVSARKMGISLATGQYTTYVDSDDWIESDMFSAMLYKIQDADVIVCGIERNFGCNISYEKNRIGDGVFYGKRLEELFAKMIYTGIFFERGITPYLCGKMFKTDILRKNQMQVPEKIRLAEDMACLYPTLLEANKIVVLPDCFYHYQMRDDSVMGVNDGSEMERYRVLYSYLKSRFAEYLKWEKCLIKQLDYLMAFLLMLRDIEILQRDKRVLFPYGCINKGAKIVIYGAGRFGHELVRYLCCAQKYTLVAWVDHNVRGNIKSPNILKEIEFDYVLVAALMGSIRNEIFNEICEMGVADSKIKIIDMALIERERCLIENILNNQNFKIIQGD